MHEPNAAPSALPNKAPSDRYVMTADDAKRFFEVEGRYDLLQRTSRIAGMLSSVLRGGRRADPNVRPAIRRANELERRLEAIFLVESMSPAPAPTEARKAPPEGDLPAMLSDAARDARYVARLLRYGAAMYVQYVPEALRVVQALRPKLEAIWAIYETLPKPELTRGVDVTQEEFWRRLEEEAASEA